MAAVVSTSLGPDRAAEPWDPFIACLNLFGSPFRLLAHMGFNICPSSERKSGTTHLFDPGRATCSVDANVSNSSCPDRVAELLLPFATFLGLPSFY